jgi:hypothetical protein
VIPEDKSLVNVSYICEVNNCGYNCEYSNKTAIKFRTHELITVAETYHANIFTKEQPVEISGKLEVLLWGTCLIPSDPTEGHS